MRDSIARYGRRPTRPKIWPFAIKSDTETHTLFYSIELQSSVAVWRVFFPPPPLPNPRSHMLCYPQPSHSLWLDAKSQQQTGKKLPVLLEHLHPLLRAEGFFFFPFCTNCWRKGGFYPRAKGGRWEFFSFPCVCVCVLLV